MLGVILTAHASYATGVYSGVKLITGGSENVRVVDFTGDNLDDYDDKLKEAIDELLNKYDSLIIATDLAGGTPFNRSVILTSDMENVEVLSGLNFQMAYELAFSESNIDDTIDSAITSAKEGILKYETPKQSDEDFEDGIW